MSRRPKDFYATPEFATEGLLARMPMPEGALVFECCSGAHHITNVLRKDPRIAAVLTNDLDPQFQADVHLDMRLPSAWTAIQQRAMQDYGRGVDLVISNPPFDVALEIILAARMFVPNVAMLLRISFMEPTEHGTKPKKLKSGRVLPATAPRAPFLEAQTPNATFYCPRISFTGDGGTDSATVVWLVWSPRPIAKPIDVIRLPRPAALMEASA